MKCEMCGNLEAINIVDIEGSRMSLCQGCSKMGKVINRIRTQTSQRRAQPIQIRQQIRQEKEEPIELINKDYGKLIKSAREKRGMKQEDFAKLIHEKESVVRHMESGEHKPSIALARKLEKYLNIKLVEQYEEKFKAGKAQDDTMTIGHIMIKTRKKQK